MQHVAAGGGGILAEDMCKAACFSGPGSSREPPIAACANSRKKTIVLAPPTLLLHLQEAQVGKAQLLAERPQLLGQLAAAGPEGLPHAPAEQVLLGQPAPNPARQQGETPAFSAAPGFFGLVQCASEALCPTRLYGRAVPRARPSIL